MSMISSEELKQIVDLAESIPEVYRQKCFEILLSYNLRSRQPSLPDRLVASPPPIEVPSTKPPVLPIDVRAFLSQYGLDESVFWKFFLIEGDQIRPIYKLKATKTAQKQIHHALMMSLENAIATGQFQVEIEALRSRCQDQNCYDGSNFTNNIKNNSKLFKSISVDQPLILSPDGKSELADLLEQLKG